MRHFSPRFSRTTPWRWKILQQLHKPTEYWSCCWQRRSQRYWAKLLPSPWNSRLHNPRKPGWKNWDIVQPCLSTAIRRAAIVPHQIQTQTKSPMYNPIADKKLTLTGTAPLTAKMWRKLTRPQLVAWRIMDTRNWKSEWTSREGWHGTGSGSTAGLPSEEGQDYIKI